MSHVVSLLMLALTCKLLAAALLARLLMRWFRDVVEAAAAGWLFIHLATIGVMAALSVGNRLTGTALWTALASMILALAVAGRRCKPISVEPTRSQDPFICASLLAILTTFAVLVYHGVLFPDVSEFACGTTIPRILLSAQDASLPGLFPPAPRFAAGWSSTTHELFYVLVSGSDLAIGFGNAELFLACCLTFTRLAGLIGVPVFSRAATGYFLATILVALNSFSTLNSIVLVCLALSLSAGWLFRYREGTGRAGLLAAAAALVLAAVSNPLVTVFAALLVPVGLIIRRFLGPRVCEVKVVARVENVFRIICRRTTLGRGSQLGWAALILGAVHVSALLINSRSTPTSFLEARCRTPFERLAGPHAACLRNGAPGSSSDVLAVERMPPQRILFHGRATQPLALFFGEDRRHHVDPCRSAGEFIEKATTGDYDLLVLGKPSVTGLPLSSDDEGRLAAGHAVIFENAHFKAYRPHGRTVVPIALPASRAPHRIF